MRTNLTYTHTLAPIHRRTHTRGDTREHTHIHVEHRELPMYSDHGYTKSDIKAEKRNEKETNFESVVVNC